MHRARYTSLNESTSSAQTTGRAMKVASAVAFAAVGLALGAQGAVTPDEATALGTTLTDIGAERSGNATGSIPPHTDRPLALPPGYQSGASRRIDPFADERPLRVLTGSNIGDMASQLTAGTRELMQRHPGFRLDVYPTHRTVAYAEPLIANTRRNAIATRTTEGGSGLENALPGVPFPIPKDGSEVMWNHRLRFIGRTLAFKYDNWFVDASGQRTLMSTGQAIQEYSAFDPKRVETLQENEAWLKWKWDISAPQRRAGEAALMIEAVNPVRQPRRAWSYLPGQRRTKLVDLADDAPNSGSGGTCTNDDNFVFMGALDRFDVKLLGKREVLLPYNTYRLSYHSNVDEVLQPRYVNPDLLRWELHRAWIVEAVLKPGQRHVYGRRVFYVDEDSWTALASDEYDLNGKLLRSLFAFLSYSYDAGAPYSLNYVAYDFGAGGYYMAYFPGPYFGVRYIEPLPSSQWSPDALAGVGVR